MTAAAQGRTVPVPPKVQLILPPAEFADDEELLTWMDLCRKISLKASDELDEDSAHIYAKLRRYARREGLGRFAANRTARSVALPIARAAEHFTAAAGYFRLGARSTEAFIEATEEPTRKSVSDFKVKGRKR